MPPYEVDKVAPAVIVCLCILLFVLVALFSCTSADKRLNEQLKHERRSLQWELYRRNYQLYMEVYNPKKV